MAWVRKDAYVSGQSVAADYVNADTERKWMFGREGSENQLYEYVGNGTTTAYIGLSIVFSLGWHFMWMRFTGGSATGLESGVDNSVATPVSVAAVAALGAVGNGHTYVGRCTASVYSSMTLATLRIHNVALSDTEIWKWRESRRSLLGL
jgi:hypothetical protein